MWFKERASWWTGVGKRLVWKEVFVLSAPPRTERDPALHQRRTSTQNPSSSATRVSTSKKQTEQASHKFTFTPKHKLAPSSQGNITIMIGRIEHTRLDASSQKSYILPSETVQLNIVQSVSSFDNFPPMAIFYLRAALAHLAPCFKFLPTMSKQ